MSADTLVMTIRSQDLDVPDNESRTVIGPGTNVKLAVTISLASVIAWGGWVTSELSTIKTVAIANSNSHAAVATKVELLTQRVDNIEQRGSTPMQLLQKSVDKLSEELRVHEAMTEQRINGKAEKP